MEPEEDYCKCKLPLMVTTAYFWQFYTAQESGNISHACCGDLVVAKKKKDYNRAFQCGHKPCKLTSWIEKATTAKILNKLVL